MRKPAMEGGLSGISKGKLCANEVSEPTVTGYCSSSLIERSGANAAILTSLCKGILS